jgi:hypothetical protein
MPLPTLTVTLADLLVQAGAWMEVSAQAGMVTAVAPWLAMAGFGAYHGLNPGMGWLFALSMGLQQRNPRAIWRALGPITLGHTASVVVVALVVLAGARFISMSALQALMAVMLIAFGVYKVFNYYRHPRWVGMKVNAADLTWWSFLMATAHGAGLMVAPIMVGLAATHAAHGHPAEAEFALAIGVHTLAMLGVMAATAWVVYQKLGLAILRRNWVNFDLIWAIALLVVGCIALVNTFWGVALPVESAGHHMH